MFVSVVNPHLIKKLRQQLPAKGQIRPDRRPQRLHAILLTTGRNCANIQVWTIHVTQLKTLNSQFSFFMKQKVAVKANLIALLDNTYPGVNKLFNSPAREDGSEKWVDYAYSFWHVDCVRKTGEKLLQCAMKLSAGNTIIFISLPNQKNCLTPLKSLLPCSQRDVL